MYKINKFQTIILDNQRVPLDESSQSYLDYVQWLRDGGIVEFTEFLTDWDIENLRESLRNEYSEKISNIKGMRESLERFVINSTPIPEEILLERDRLKAEYAVKVQELYESN